jgi:aminopeptidase
MAYDGDATALGEDDWTALGFNHSTTHTDIVSTTDRTVTATLRDGTTRVIYESGQFALDL